jgi:hypothetical protein
VSTVAAAAGVNWTDIFLGTAAVVSAVAAWVSVHFTRKSHDKVDRHAEMKAVVQDAFHPLDMRVLALESQCNNMPVTIDSLIVRALKPIEAQLIAQNTKIDPVWRALEELAVDMAKNLHHPDPDRADFDNLLDHFMAHTLTADEDLQLRRLLNQVKQWRPGVDLGFTVYDGEPTYAAILLRTMELSRIRIRQEQRNE